MSQLCKSKFTCTNIILRRFLRSCQKLSVEELKLLLRSKKESLIQIFPNIYSKTKPSYYQNQTVALYRRDYLPDPLRWRDVVGQLLHAAQQHTEISEAPCR